MIQHSVQPIFQNRGLNFLGQVVYNPAMYFFKCFRLRLRGTGISQSNHLKICGPNLEEIMVGYLSRRMSRLGIQRVRSSSYFLRKSPSFLLNYYRKEKFSLDKSWHIFWMQRPPMRLNILYDVSLANLVLLINSIRVWCHTYSFYRLKTSTQCEPSSSTIQHSEASL